MRPQIASCLQLILPILGCFGGGSLYGWSGLMPAVQDAFDVGSAAASMVFSFALASFTLGVLLGPAMLGLIPGRLRLFAVAVVAAASLSVSGYASGFGVFVLAYGIGFGFTSGALYNHAIACATASDHPNLFVPVSVAAFGLGGVVFGPVNVWLTELGWSLWSVLPALTCLALIAFSALLSASNQQADKAGATTGVQFVMPDRTILRLWAIFATGSCSGLIVLGLASMILATDATSTAMTMFAVATGNTLGRLTAAGVALRFGPVPGIIGALLLSILALFGLMTVSTPDMVIFLLFLVALSYGQVASQTPLLVSRQVPGPAFAGTFGWVFTGWGCAGLLGPWGAGWLFEKSGDLRVALMGCILLCFLGVWLTVRLPAPSVRTEWR